MARIRQYATGIGLVVVCLLLLTAGTSLRLGRSHLFLFIGLSSLLCAWGADGRFRFTFAICGIGLIIGALRLWPT
jgi:hypothetical protein